MADCCYGSTAVAGGVVIVRAAGNSYLATSDPLRFTSRVIQYFVVVLWRARRCTAAGCAAGVAGGAIPFSWQPRVQLGIDAALGHSRVCHGVCASGAAGFHRSAANITA